MSLPDFTTQAALFSISSRTDQLFCAAGRYRLFSSKIYPLLVSARAPLEKLYCLDNGRPAVEPVLLSVVSLSVWATVSSQQSAPSSQNPQHNAQYAPCSRRPSADASGSSSVHPIRFNSAA